MVPLIRTKPIDLNRLSNIEQVFGLSLIAIEIVLVGWIYKSTGAFERVGMGVCFVALLAVLGLGPINGIPKQRIF